MAHLDPLPDADKLIPLMPSDQQCLQELRLVLERHGAINRFGICLLHQHFPMEDDEVLMETVDVAERKLTIMPVKTTESTGMIETTWRLAGGNDQVITFCLAGCKWEKDRETGSFEHMVTHRIAQSHAPGPAQDDDLPHQPKT